MSVKFLSASLGPEMAAPILWTPKNAFFLQEKPMSIKFRVLGGGVFGVFGGGGGECRFYFYGRGNFSDTSVALLLSRHTLSRFSPYVFAVSHESRATPLKVSQKRPCCTRLGAVSHLNFALYRSSNCVAVQGVSHLQCRESRYTAPLRSCPDQRHGTKHAGKE